jgi:hypothetical protein
VTPGFTDLAKSLRPAHAYEGRSFCNSHKEAFINVVGSITLPGGEVWKEPLLPEVLRDELLEREVAIIQWPKGTPRPPLDNQRSFRAAFAEQGVVIPAIRFVLLIEGDTVHSYLLADKSEDVWETDTIVSSTAPERRGVDYATLGNRKVAIVGCGSVGSKIAVMLARSGVGRFLLIDDDILLPDNLVRNELDWREIATHKADSLGRRIQLVNPWTICEKRLHRLGGQESSGGLESLIEALGGCDLVIDATADHNVFNYLCAVAEIARKPLSWVEVFGGGFGGLVARHRPGVEPAPAKMRRAIEQWCDDRGKPALRAAGRYGGDATTPMIADDADVTVIAAHCARLSLDTLIGRAPSLFPYSVYLIGLAAKWNFDAPFDTYPIDVSAVDTVETSPVLTEDQEAEERNRSVRLFAEFKDATAATRTSS